MARRPISWLQVLELFLPWVLVVAVLASAALEPRQVISWVDPFSPRLGDCGWLGEWAIAHGQHVVSCTSGVLKP